MIALVIYNINNTNIESNYGVNNNINNKSNCKSNHKNIYKHSQYQYAHTNIIKRTQKSTEMIP